jgi:hypothetical protein
MAAAAAAALEDTTAALVSAHARTPATRRRCSVVATPHLRNWLPLRWRAAMLCRFFVMACL